MTMYIAIFGLECLPVSEFCGEHNEHFCSIKRSRRIIEKLVTQPVKEFFSN
jgi:hypothetical protein